MQRIEPRFDLADALPDWQIESTDVRHVWHQVSRTLKPFRILPEADVHYHARLFHRSLSTIDVVMIDYGGPIAIEAGTLGGFTLVQIPLRGSYTCVQGRRQRRVGTNQAHLVPPTVPLTMRWSADCRLLVIRLNALAALEANNRTTADERFGPVVDLAAARLKPLVGTLNYALHESLCGDLLMADAEARRSISSLLLLALRGLFESGERKPLKAPEALMRAVAYIQAHLDTPLDFVRLQAISGIGRSALAKAFKQYFGLGPLGWAQLQRLERVREDLLAAPASNHAVTDTALRWGFNHMGRFAGAYARRYGETPRATLQRARAEHQAPSSASQVRGLRP